MKPDISTVKLRYTIYGILFGLVFPVVAVGYWMWSQKLSLSWQGVIVVHLSNPLLFIIDTAPIFLGTLAYLAGLRQARVDTLLNDLHGVLRERENMVEELTGLRTELIRIIDKKVVQLQTAAKVARDAAAIQDLASLLEEAVHLISQRFGFYHTGIFLIEESDQFAVLHAASSEGGRRMLVRQHKLKIGEEGIVGYVSRMGQARIAHDVGTDAVYFDNPDLPQTRSEMALPLRVRSQIIGVLDVQSTKAAAFGDEDVEILQILADQIALAISNVKYLAETRSAYQELENRYSQNIYQAWSNRNELSQGRYRYNRFGLPSISKSPNGSSKELSSGPNGKEPTHTSGKVLRVPIILRDITIGHLQLTRQAEHSPWSALDREVTAMVVKQLSLALENARLLTENQRQAQDQRLVSLLTGELQGSFDLETVMRRAAAGIGKALGVERIRIQLTPDNGRVEQFSRQAKTGFGEEAQ